MFGFVIGFILGAAAALVYSILKPIKWGKAQTEVKDEIS